MSDWGIWGYTGIVAGLVLMVAVGLLCLVFSYSTTETSTKKSTTKTKHTA
jgi:hypothetical protein